MLRSVALRQPMWAAARGLAKKAKKGDAAPAPLKQAAEAPSSSVVVGLNILKEGQDPELRPDSEYAAKTIAGVWPADGENRALIMTARAMLKRVEESGRQVWIANVRAHRGHAWNERADVLAGIGAEGWHSGAGRAWQAWPQERSGMPRDDGAGGAARQQVEECMVCFGDFEDPARPGVDASMPTPALESRAPEELWRCQHAPCRGCFADAKPRPMTHPVRIRCPLCRQPGIPNRR